MYFESFVYFNEFYLSYPRFEKSLGKERELFFALIATNVNVRLNPHFVFPSYNRQTQQQQCQLPFTFYIKIGCGIAHSALFDYTTVTFFVGAFVHALMKHGSATRELKTSNSQGEEFTQFHPFSDDLISRVRKWNKYFLHMSRAYDSTSPNANSLRKVFFVSFC